MAYKGKAQQQAERPVKPARDADGVTYTSAAGLKMFACAPYRATLSQGGCANRWREAQDATGHRADSLASCRGCAIGAAHAGEEHVAYSPLYGVSICPACRRGAMRMIHNKLCVSCYNRRREMRTGKNARGNTPVELMERPLRPVEYILQVNGKARRARAAAVGDLLEPMIQTLRTTKGIVGFAFAGFTAGIRQGRLF